MDFFDPKKKRAHTIKLYIGYCLVGVALLIGTLLVWYQTYGYDIDRRTGTIVQKGLVFVDAHPQSAAIYLNGEHKGQTSARFTPVSGHYSLELKREGYKTWKHDFDLYGGTIERFVYPFLFPEKLLTSEKNSSAVPPSFASESPDRHWLVLSNPESVAKLDLIDLTNKDAVLSTISLPADSLTATKEPESIEAVEWASDNRHLLLKHNFGADFEFVLIDRESPADSINLNKAFSIKPTTVTLRDKKADQFYFYSKESLAVQSAELKTRTVLPLLSRVLDYRSHGNSTLIYVTDAGAKAGKVAVKIHEGDKDYTLRELPAGTTYLLNLAEFNGHWYMAAGDVIEGKVSIYLDPVASLRKTGGSALPISTLRLDNPSGVLFSTNARFIMAQSGSNFAVYDAERDKQFKFNSGLTDLQPIQAKWMDGHRIAVVSENRVVVMDFDGTNLHKLSPASPNYPVFFSKDYDALYSLAPSKTAGQIAVTRTELIVK